MDIQNVGLSDCFGDTLEYFKKLSAMNKHYPERVYKTILITPPSFGMVWRVVAPMIDINVREKISVFQGKDFVAPLLELVDADQIPEAYGGTAQVGHDLIATVMLCCALPQPCGHLHSGSRGHTDVPRLPN